MSDTPIAERLAAELGIPWPLGQGHQRMNGSIFDYYFSEPGANGSETGAGEPREGYGSRPPRRGPYPHTSGAEREPSSDEH